MAYLQRVRDPAGAYLEATGIRSTARSRRRADSLLSENTEHMPPSILLPFASDHAGLQDVAARLAREGEILLSVPGGEIRASLIHFRRGDAVFEGRRRD
jgi:hypothetical protein